jgi:hypothetical protein
MFSIEWLNGSALLERKATGLTNVQRVVDFARREADAVKRRHPGAEPTCFQVSDGTSGFLAVYMIEGGPGRYTELRW